LREPRFTELLPAGGVFENRSARGAGRTPTGVVDLITAHPSRSDDGISGGQMALEGWPVRE
jgi:hypothetical protein